MSHEHLWPRWARRTLSPDERKLRVESSLHRDGAPPFKTWEARIFSGTVRRVCEQCNSGWMSRIESRVRPYAEPLIRGETRELDRQAQVVLSIWAYLKCLLCLVTDEEMPVEIREAHKTFYEIQEDDLLPLSTSVFTAWHVGPRWGQYQHRLIGNPSTGMPSYFVGTFTICQLTVQVVKSYLSREPLIPPRHRAVAHVDQMIWPPARPFSWPPGPGLDDRGLTLYTGPQPSDATSVRERIRNLLQRRRHLPARVMRSSSGERRPEHRGFAA